MTLSNGKTSAYQWDIGLTVPTTDAEGTVRRFTNEHSARSIPVACAEDGDGNMVYAIPNILLTTGRPIIMFTLAGDNDGIIYTDTQEYLPVYPAPKPDDYIYTEAEINLWKSLCDRMDTAESNIATNTENIGTNAGNIASNTLAIGQNTLDIAANALAIGANTSDINALKAAPHIYRFPLEENGGVLSTTATFAEVVAAFQRGDYIVANVWGLELTMLIAEYTDPPDEDLYITFTTPWPADDGATIIGQGYVYCELNNGTWTFDSWADTLPQWLAPDITDPSLEGYVPTITSDGVEWQAQQGGGGSGLTNDAKDAILQIARKVAYIDSGGETYYNELYDALYPLASISAVYTQSGTVYDTDSLDSLKSDLVVTATYSDGGTSTIPSTDYTLSGTLTAGTSTITVTYGGKTTTFTVTVTHVAVLSSISAVYTQSGTVYSTTPLDSLKTDLVVTAHYDDSTSATVPGTDYTLSGTLTTGTSTITVSYGGMTTTFTVTVSAVTLVSISAVYTQSGTVYETASLDSLKTDLVVTATYSDTSTATIPSTDYTLSGTLTVGTSTITASYGGETATFTVTVTANTVVSISAAYTQSGTVYDTDALNSLKADLVVTATYADTSTATVPSTDYTLSGTLVAGTSTITVTYEGETTTFTVTVTQYVRTPIYDFDLTQSATDSIGGIVSSGTASRDSSGLHFTANDTYWDFGAIYDRDRTYEVDVLSHEQNGHGGTNAYGRIFAVDTDNNTASGGSCVIFTGNKRTGNNSGKAGWSLYCGSGWDNTLWSNIGDAAADNNYNDAFFDGKTVQVKVNSSGYVTVRYKTISADDSTYITLVTSTTAFKAYTNGHVYAGSSGAGASDFLRDTTITGLRVYSGVN